MKANSVLSVARLISRASIFLFLLSIIFSGVGAQTPAPGGGSSTPIPAGGTGGSMRSELPSLKDDKPETPSGFDEILVRKRITLAKQEYHENVDRAREISQVGAEILDEFNKSQQLTAVDMKKLEHIEKLAKKLREETGAGDGNEEQNQVPTDLKSALVRLSKVSDELRDKIEKTSYMEVSMAVISRTNEVLALVKFVRALHPATS